MARIAETGRRLLAGLVLLLVTLGLSSALLIHDGVDAAINSGKVDLIALGAGCGLLVLAVLVAIGTRDVADIEARTSPR